MFEETSGERFKLAKHDTPFEWNDAISECIFSGSAEALVRCGGNLPIAYFLGNMYAKHNENLIMLSRVTAKMSGMFLDTVYIHNITPYGSKNTIYTSKQLFKNTHEKQTKNWKKLKSCKLTELTNLSHRSCFIDCRLKWIDDKSSRLTEFNNAVFSHIVPHQSEVIFMVRHNGVSHIFYR